MPINLVGELVRICQGGVGIRDVSWTTPENRPDRAAPKVTQAFITSDRITDHRYDSGPVPDNSANLLLIQKLDY
jgi:hypothetical protein